MWLKKKAEVESPLKLAIGQALETIAALEERAVAVLTVDQIEREKCEMMPNYSEVLEKAATLLDYHPRDNRLNNVLAELGIEYLNRAQVMAYMESKSSATYKFVRYELERYNLPIPLHVINKMIQIKERLPEAKFLVYNYERMGSAAGDPFLFVMVNNFGWYIEVWDEPEFEGRARK